MQIGGSLRRARAATGAVAHTEPPRSAAPAAPDRRRNALRVTRSHPSMGRIVASQRPCARRMASSRSARADSVSVGS